MKYYCKNCGMELFVPKDYEPEEGSLWCPVCGRETIGGRMKGEIDKDFYCSYLPDANYCPRNSSSVPFKCSITNCRFRHRKWPTPEQFKEEYGEEWKGPCYTLVVEDEQEGGELWDYDIQDYGLALTDNYGNLTQVCACTYWDKPPADWRPE